MHLAPIAKSSFAPTWRRALLVAAGAAMVCALLLPPLLHFGAEASWPDGLRWGIAAGLGTGAMILVFWIMTRAADALLNLIPHRTHRRPRRSAKNSPAARTQMMATLDAVEAELRRIGYWQIDPPDLMARFASGELKSYLDAPSFELWLQTVFLPNARKMINADQLPPFSSVGVMAMRQYDYHSFIEEAQALLRLLIQFDAQANAYVGHDPLGG